MRALASRSARTFALTFAIFGILYTGQSSPAVLFKAGAQAYHEGDYTNALLFFRQAALAHPASGTLQNVGNAEWQNGRVGQAVLAWEQARWLDPFNDAVKDNLKFARRTAQLETPELSWFEFVSSWLPVNWWAWITGLSFWFAVGISSVPGMLRVRKTATQQAAAAFSLAIFLLSLPAHFGVDSRANIGFILDKNTPLRLTPTDEAQFLTHLQSGDPARLERVRGKYVLIRTSRASGWVEQRQLGLLSPRDRSH